MSKMGERIRKMRTELGLSGEELGRRLGVQRAAVNKWENGDVENIKRSTIAEMARIFDCSPVWLMGFDVDVNNKIADTLSNIDPKSVASSIMNPRDRRLIELYRRLSEDSQKSIMDMAEFLYNKEKDVN